MRRPEDPTVDPYPAPEGERLDAPEEAERLAPYPGPEAETSPSTESVAAEQQESAEPASPPRTLLTTENTTAQRYYPYGAQRGTGQVATPYRYTGQREEAAIGLYYYKARWYDPALGRFIQADTVVPEPGNPQAYNRYSYVMNNPVRYSDPSGHLHDPSADYPDEPSRFSYYHLSSQPRFRQDWFSQGSRWRWAGEEDYRTYLQQANWLGNEQLVTAYAQVNEILSIRDLLSQIGKQEKDWGAGLWFSRDASTFRYGPDGTILTYGGFVWPNAGAWTAADVIILPTAYVNRYFPDDHPRYKALLNHEFCHVLQVRKEGKRGFYLRYVGQMARVIALNLQGQDTSIWDESPYERDVALPVDDIYQAHPDLPSIWEFPIR